VSRLEQAAERPDPVRQGAPRDPQVLGAALSVAPGVESYRSTRLPTELIGVVLLAMDRIVSLPQQKLDSACPRSGVSSPSLLDRASDQREAPISLYGPRKGDPRAGSLTEPSIPFVEAADSRTIAPVVGAPPIRIWRLEEGVCTNGGEGVSTMTSSHDENPLTRKPDSQMPAGWYPNPAGAQAIVDGYRSRFASSKSVHVAPGIADHKLAHALKSFGDGLTTEDVLVLFDNTVFGGAKEGAILSRQALHSHELMQAPSQVPYEKIEDVHTEHGWLFINGHKSLNMSTAAQDDRNAFVELLRALAGSQVTPDPPAAPAAETALPQSVGKPIPQATEQPTARPAKEAKTRAASWQPAPVDKGDVVLTCPSCSNESRLSLAAFKADATEQIGGLEKTGAKLTGGNDRMLSFVLALLTYYIVHSAMWESDVPLNQGVLVPVLAAVLVFGLGPVVGSLIRQLFGVKLTVYSFTCPSCGSGMLLASNGEIAVTPGEKGPGER
jgi:hypothetical protein